MIKYLALATCLFLSACVSLPGEDEEPAARYMLNGPDQDCSSEGKPLILSIIKVSSGLDSERIATRDASTGQFTYLQGVRWVDRSGIMLEQRLAKDLECKGFSVITSHHAQLNNNQLVCEVRALNLVQSSDGNRAEVALSCIKFHSHGKKQDAIMASHSTPLRSWGINEAMDAMAESYARVLEELTSKL